MSIEKKVKEVIKNYGTNNQVKHFDKIYKETCNEKKENRLPNLENRHKSEDLKNIKYQTIN